MGENNMSKKTITSSSRRKFFKAAAVTGAAAVATVAMPNVWYGKNAAASLFGTGPSYGFSSIRINWMD
jgi:anaerobic selenocysteine-containing dehydrogenase